MNEYGPLHTHIVGDCFETMPDLEKSSFDLMLTDPPYNMPASYYSGKTAMRKWSDTSIMQVWWRLFTEKYLPLLKPNAMVLVFTGQSALPVFWPVMYKHMGLQLAVWNRMAPTAGLPMLNTCEYVIVGWVGKQYVSEKGVANLFNHKRIPPAGRIHPAQKPASLIKRLVELYCPPGGNVLDPFAGSCVTAGVCEESGRRCTTIEWDDDFDNGRML